MGVGRGSGPWGWAVGLGSGGWAVGWGGGLCWPGVGPTARVSMGRAGASQVYHGPTLPGAPLWRQLPLWHFGREVRVVTRVVVGIWRFFLLNIKIYIFFSYFLLSPGFFVGRWW